jgi:hypothetical protein
MLTYILLAFIGIISALFLALFGWFLYECCLKWLEANSRAKELLRSMLTDQQYRQLMHRGYLDIKSPRKPACVYRVPKSQGLVHVIDGGIRKMSLCLQPVEWVPDADVVVMHKLMIEADEETYLRTANKLRPI